VIWLLERLAISEDAHRRYHFASVFFRSSDPTRSQREITGDPVERIKQHEDRISVMEINRAFVNSMDNIPLLRRD